MAFGDLSSPARFGGGQTGATQRELFLDVFGGEVLTSFDIAVTTMDKHRVKTVSGGAKSWRFPKTHLASAEYHTPGQEMLGNDFETAEVTVDIDQTLVSHYALADIDVALSHFDVRQPLSQQMGHSLAKVFDKNVYRQLCLAARTSAVGSFPAGGTTTDASLVDTTSADGKDWIDAIRAANIDMFNKDIPETLPRYCAVNANVFDAIKYAVDSNGQYLIINRDFGHPGAGGIQSRAGTGTWQNGPASAGEYIDIDGVMVFRTRNLPTADERSVNTVFSKYRADYSTMTGVMWAPEAVCTVKLMDIGFETERDTRRLEDFMVAKMLVGHGTLRPECAHEFRTTAPST